MNLPAQISGNGPALVLVHGWGLGRQSWDAVLPQLEAHFRVHRLSLPGYDGSRSDERDFLATAALVAAAVPPGALLAGWSLGGLIALAAAAQADHIGPLVLVATTPKFVAAADWPIALPAAVHDEFIEAMQQTPVATLTRFVTRFNRGDTRMRDCVRQLAPLAAAALPDAPTLAKGLAWLRDVDLRGAVAGLDQAALVLHGECDPLIPFAAGEWLAAELPHARLQRCSGAAHAPFVADAAGFVNTLINFHRDTDRT